MTLYLYQNDAQTGPFTEEQLQQMLQSGSISTETMAWKDGMGGWEPLGKVLHLPTQPLPPPPPKKTNILAWISLIFSVVSVVGWVILLVAAGVAHNRGTATQSFNVVVGFFFLGGIVLNVFALIMGIIASFQKDGRVIGILGLCFNAVIIVALILLMALGLAIQHAHYQP